MNDYARIEKLLERVATALEKIEKHLAPNKIDFSDARVIESFWGDAGPMHS